MTSRWKFNCTGRSELVLHRALPRFFRRWKPSTAKAWWKHHSGENKRTARPFLIDTFWLSFQLSLMHFHPWDFVLAPLREKRLTQTWLMRQYWLWPRWQLLIRGCLWPYAEMGGGGGGLPLFIWIISLLHANAQRRAFFHSARISPEASHKLHAKNQGHTVHFQSSTWCWTTEAERRFKLITSSTLLF